MPKAPVPRRRTFVQSFARDHGRIRRLEVNRTPIRSGVAAYAITLSSPPATATWTPDWSTAEKAYDTIGCHSVTAGIVVPEEWMYWAMIGWSVLASTPPPTGDALVWSFTNGASFGGAATPADYHTDLLFDTSGDGADPQLFGGNVQGATGPNDDQGAFLPEVTSLMGTEFTPTAATILIQAIQLFTPSLSVGGGGD